MKIRGKTVFVTGGAGFIGTALARRLISDNRVIIYDNGHRGRLAADLSAHANIEYCNGDVLDFDVMKQAMRGADYVLHLASIAGVDTVMKMPAVTMKTSIIGTYHALEAARAEKSVLRFIDFSTSEVFGQYAYNVNEGNVTSLGPVGEARWTYAVSKLASEHLAHTYFKEYGLPTVSVRPFNVYGPGQIGEGAIHHFVLRAIKGEPLIIHNDGGQIRAWCYIDDIIAALLLCMSKSEALGEVFNIGNPRSVCTIYNLAQQIVSLSESRSEISFERRAFADVELRVPNIEKARQVLGYEPGVDLAQGLSRTINWYRSKLEGERSYLSEPLRSVVI